MCEECSDAPADASNSSIPRWEKITEGQREEKD
jgi:hypothetical protein